MLGVYGEFQTWLGSIQSLDSPDYKAFSASIERAAQWILQAEQRFGPLNSSPDFKTTGTVSQLSERILEQTVRRARSVCAPESASPEDLSRWIERLPSLLDHTLLKPEATETQILKAAEEARDFNFATVCVQPLWIQAARSRFERPIAVIAFPHGASTARAIEAEVQEAVQSGAIELDTVLAVGLLKSGKWAECYALIRAAVEAAGARPVKVILETSKLSDEEILLASWLSLKAGAPWIKTSTGFAESGARIKDVCLMKAVAGDTGKVKASGGIRSARDAWWMCQAGAERLGVSASIALVTQARSRELGERDSDKISSGAASGKNHTESAGESAPKKPFQGYDEESK